MNNRVRFRLLRDVYMRSNGKVGDEGDMERWMSARDCGRLVRMSARKCGRVLLGVDGALDYGRWVHDCERWAYDEGDYEGYGRLGYDYGD
ncbi:hypothetical protein VNO78_01064 [Psophocarpus tetragonolobus]|uniref:Uncharacterized protein n=1 Tax=Psophocarpus tetragonolobus TaxID=3891 RepID=A0AAN9T022_PSOTE